VLWIFYDLRMGSEFFGYLAKDYRTYWSQPIGSRTLRERAFFYDFAEQVRRFSVGEDRYVFVSTQPWPYIGILRYLTYPSVPADAEHADGSETAWAIHERPDITLSERGELTENGKVISPQGEIFHEYAPGTFLFLAEP
jgi:hypothetical protein